MTEKDSCETECKKTEECNGCNVIENIKKWFTMTDEDRENFIKRQTNGKSSDKPVQ